MNKIAFEFGQIVSSIPSVSTARNGIYYDDNDQRVGFALRPKVQRGGAELVLSGLA
jgi:hypothetical protein